MCGLFHSGGGGRGGWTCGEAECKSQQRDDRRRKKRVGVVSNFGGWKTKKLKDEKKGWKSRVAFSPLFLFPPDTDFTFHYRSREYCTPRERERRTPRASHHTSAGATLRDSSKNGSERAARDGGVGVVQFTSCFFFPKIPTIGRRKRTEGRVRKKKKLCTRAGALIGVVPHRPPRAGGT